MLRRPFLVAAFCALALLAAAPAFAVEPGAPLFSAPRTLPVSSGFGEPSIASAPDGTLYVTAPGSASALWRSLDGGQTWRRVADSLGSSGDSDVAVDANGVVYVSDLFSNVPVSVSLDRGDSFAYESATANGGNIDRQWTAAVGNGHVYSAWRDGSTERVAVSHDRGVSYTRHVVATGVGLQGNILAVDEDSVIIPFSGSGMRIARSDDAGVTWQQKVVSTAGSTVLFPAVAVDAAGNIYVAWSAPSRADLDIGYEVKVARSRDGGNSWSSATTLSQPGRTAIFPWIVAGDEGRVAVAWYDGRTPGDVGIDPDIAALTTWTVAVAFSDDAHTGLSAGWSVADATPVVHTGPICTMGTACFPVRNPVALNRALLDFFEMAAKPDGSLVIAYTADQTGAPLNPTGATFLKVVVQTGGPDLKV